MQSSYGLENLRSAPARTAVPGKRIAIVVFVLAYLLIIALLAAPRGYLVTDPGPVSGVLATPAAQAPGAS